MPEHGFYKQDKINIINNEEEEPEDLTDDLEDEPDKPEQDEPEDKPEPDKPEKTIRDLLMDIFNKLDELETANTNQIKKTNGINRYRFYNIK